MFLVDLSASGAFGSTRQIKNEVAAEICALLAFSAIKNNDKVGLIVFTDQIEMFIPPAKGSTHVLRLIRDLLNFTPRQTQTDISVGIEYLGRVTNKKSVVFLISDFLTEDFNRNATLKIKAAARKHELISVLVSDPGEFNLPAAGIVALKDLENGSVRYMDASDRTTRETFTAGRQVTHNTIRKAHKSMDMDCIEMPTDGDAAEALVKYFRYREQRRR